MGKCDEPTTFSSRFMKCTWLNVVLVIIVGAWAILGLAEIIIGGIYINDCSSQDMIPVWLIADAIIPIFFVAGFALHFREGDNKSVKLYGSMFLVIAMILSIGWHVCGAVWIYPTWNNDKKDCNEVPAIFSFAMITFHWCTMWMWINIVWRLLAYHCRPSNV